MLACFVLRICFIFPIEEGFRKHSRHTGDKACLTSGVHNNKSTPSTHPAVQFIPPHRRKGEIKSGVFSDLLIAVVVAR